MTNEYPAALYRGAESCVVQNAAERAAKEAEGFASPASAEAPVEAPAVSEPEPTKKSKKKVDHDGD
jgi:hypothetical protein